MPDVTQPNVREMTTYQYDARGQLTSESRIDSDFDPDEIISYDNQGRLARVEDQNKAPAAPICDVRYAYDEWGNVRRIQATYTQTVGRGTAGERQLVRLRRRGPHDGFQRRTVERRHPPQDAHPAASDRLRHVGRRSGNDGIRAPRDTYHSHVPAHLGHDARRTLRV